MSPSARDVSFHRRPYRWAPFYVASCVFLLCAGATQIARADTPRPLTQEITYHERPDGPLREPAVAIVCITTGVGLRNSGESGMGANIGHSALSIFDLEGAEQSKRDPYSYKVHSTSFWPDKGYDRGQSTGDPTWQVDNKPGDHFLTFAQSTLYGSQNGRHCVLMTQSEKDRLKAFQQARKTQKWTPFYNCNDLAIEGFLGVMFDGKSLQELRDALKAEEKEARKKGIPVPSSPLRDYLGSVSETAGVMLPHAALRGLRNFQRTAKAAGTLRYLARDPQEIGKIQELQELGKITVPLFKGIKASAEPIDETVHSPPLVTGKPGR